VVPIYCCNLEILRFWEISRNCLAGDEPPPGNSYVMCCFGVLGREPPGGTLPAARWRLGFTLIFGFADEAPGGAGWTARRRGAIFPVLGFSRILGYIWSVGKLFMVNNRWIRYCMVCILRISRYKWMKQWFNVKGWKRVTLGV